MSSEAAASTLLAVCGAHLDGQPLNPFLLSLGAVLVETARTAPVYRMVALPPLPEVPGRSPVPARPGLIRCGDGGASIDVELYDMPVRSLGALLVTVAPPLALGTLTLAGGSEVIGFVCESYAGATAPDITHLGSWRDYHTPTA